ncbi:hypothetical protein ABPG74_020979 [Tetrahymena malaccensis]
MKQKLKLFLLFSLTFAVFGAHNLIGNKKMRNLQPTMKTPINPTQQSTSSQIRDVGSANASTSGLSLGASIAVYIAASVGAFLLLMLLNYLWKKCCCLERKAKQAREKIMKEIQQMRQNSQQQAHQISQIPVFYNLGQPNSNIQGYPQNFELQVNPNQNKSTSYY